MSPRDVTLRYVVKIYGEAFAVHKGLSKLKTTLSTGRKHKLTPYHNRPPHLCGLPNVLKPDIPLRHIMSSDGSQCCTLPGFLHKVVSPLAGKSGSFVKNSYHFIQLLKSDRGTW
jgi:hypothetical protein